MRVEVHTQHGKRPEAHFRVLTYDLPDDCQRVLVIEAAQLTGGQHVWGFRADGRQVDGVLIRDDPDAVIT